MYELRQGTARIVTALHNRKEDPVAIQRIAQALDYIPQQLQEDIQALYDFFLQAGADDNREES